MAGTLLNPISQFDESTTSGLLVHGISLETLIAFASAQSKIITLGGYRILIYIRSINP